MLMENSVQYRDIPGFHGYRVGDDGTVWSCRTGAWKEWRQLKACVGHAGRLFVSLFRNGKIARRAIHRLVLEAFVGSCPPGMECCHWDGDPTNNTLGNLRWDTHVNNCADKKRHGTQTRGKYHPNGKLEDSEVLEIYRRWQAGESQSVLASEFSVTQTTVSSIVRHKHRISAIPPAERRGFGETPPLSVSAANAVKTHCLYGHPFDEANTYVKKSGSRCCRECARQHHKLRMRALRAKALASGLEPDAQEGE